MPKWVAVFLVSFFVGVGIFSFSKSVSLSRNNKELIGQINNIYEPKIAKITAGLGKARSSLKALEQENDIIEDTLRSRNEELRELRALYEEREDVIAKITNRYSELKSENNLLKDKISAMFLEFSEMKKILSSLESLKERIRSLKKIGKKRSKNSQSSDQGIARYGNHGFLIRNGKNTYVPKVRILVKPVEG